MSFAATTTRASFSRLFLLLVLQLAMVPDFERTLVRADGYGIDECQAFVKSSKAVGNKPQNQLPTCTCGDEGSMSSVTFYDSSSRQTTSLSVCSGCPGKSVRVTSSDLCDTAPNSFHPFLNLLCKGVLGLCKDISFYRCSCPVTTSIIPTITIPTITIPTISITTPDIGFTGIVGDTVSPGGGGGGSPTNMDPYAQG